MKTVVEYKKYSIELYDIKQRQKTSYFYSAMSGYNYQTTFTQTFLVGCYYFQPDEEETFGDTTRKTKAGKDVCVSAFELSNATIKIVTLEAHGFF